MLNVQSLSASKIDAVGELITDRSLDPLALTETWHSSSDDARLHLVTLTPAGYAVVDAARPAGRGGGVAVVYRDHLKCSQIALPRDTFEALCVRLTASAGPVILLNIYRPGFSRPSETFYHELAFVLVAHACPVIVGGDFNVHVHDADDADARRLRDLLTTFDMVQHVNSPTRLRGGTLDLLVTFADQSRDVSVDSAGIYSDHALVTCQLPVAVGHVATAEWLVRGWRRVDRDVFCRALEDNPLCQPVADDANVDDLFTEYETVLAPLHVIRRPAGRLAPWFDASCRKVRRHCRRLERRYRRTCRADDRRRWVDAARCRFRLYQAKKETYWMDRLTHQGRSSSQLWQTLSTMLGRDLETSGTTSHTADGFAEFFRRYFRPSTMAMGEEWGPTPGRLGGLRKRHKLLQLDPGVSLTEYKFCALSSCQKANGANHFEYSAVHVLH